MKAALFIDYARRLTSLQVMYITFRSGDKSVRGLRGIVNLTRSPGADLRLAEGADVKKIQRILDNDKWEDNDERTISVYGMSEVPSEEIDLFAEHVESVSTSDHLGTELVTKIPHEREHAAEQIVRRVLSTNFRKRAEGKGITIVSETKGALSKDKPEIQFLVQRSETGGVMKIVFDAWSGRAKIDDVWNPKCHQRPQEFQDTIRQVIETLTAAA